MYRPRKPCRLMICLAASTVPIRGLLRRDGSWAAPGAARARLDTRTEVWTTFLASSKGPTWDVRDETKERLTQAGQRGDLTSDRSCHQSGKATSKRISQNPGHSGAPWRIFRDGQGRCACNSLDDICDALLCIIVGGEVQDTHCGYTC